MTERGKKGKQVGERRRSQGKRVRLLDEQQFAVLNVNAAGIDVGSAEHYVAVPPGRDARPVRKFGCFTADLHRMAQWLVECGIDTVAMQATGVYWIALHQILEDYGLRVTVSNARYTKMLPGRKSDVQECQWLQQLHTFGLLTASFIPAEEFRVLRSYLRQRENLVADAGMFVQRMQKALTEMNVQLANVISDLSGKSGMAIVRAILSGERDRYRLADLCDRRIQASREQVAHSLEGDWRPELLFALQQNLELYERHLLLIAECDKRIEAHFGTIDRKVDAATTPPPPARRKGMQPRRKHIPQFDVRTHLYQVSGVDLTQIDGINVQTAEVVLSEVGIDMGRWSTEKKLGSWLGLSPANSISGGKVLKRGTKKVANRAATALRLAAQSLTRSKSALGAKFRRLRARLGAPKATTAMAYHLARLIYRMLRYGHQYVDKGMEHYEAKYREHQMRNLQKQAARHGMQLVPVAAVAN